MWRFGKKKPEFASAALTRAYDSRTARSGKPTIWKPGWPAPCESTSMVIRTALIPRVAALPIFESMRGFDPAEVPIRGYLGRLRGVNGVLPIGGSWSSLDQDRVLAFRRRSTSFRYQS